ncbi:nitroreductase [Oleiagrimonas sp. C23AA]|uniref:nitroreductase family protein n=1 Tax=Oleiagrimonas sp. C23AA TaxID=2719047 RepID=UPI00141FBA08|nr:nitroreductase [Oleiagrimonas sp. C23AA]NII11568.1 nitroreductase [Oleiagrimonas sp. C23AA]
MSLSLDALNLRRSVPSKQLTAPGPDAGTLRQLLEMAIRVPDHGKLTPWRMLLLEGEAKLAFGERLARIAVARNPDLPDSKREKEQRRYTFAPLVIAVIASPNADSKVPAIEQLMSAGAVCTNLLYGAQALGFGAQWLTGWAAYDDDAHALMGMAPHEKLIGFIHIGTPKIDVPERDRPKLNDHIHTWTP